MDSIIFEDKNFEFGIESGVGVRETPWKSFAVKSKRYSNAEKYAVRVYLEQSYEEFRGTPVEFEVMEIGVNFHGCSSIDVQTQTVSEYIQTLNEAVAFAERVQGYFESKGMKVPFTNK